MADIGAVGRYGVGLLRTPRAAQAGVGSVFPLPRSNVGRRLGDWLSGVIEATRTRLHTRTPQRAPKKEYHHPRREVFLEHAAMSREMHRL
jgi:hypothetical protein